MRQIATFLRCEDGPTAAEYAIMLAFIVLVCIVAVTALGTNTNGAYSKANRGWGAS